VLDRLGNPDAVTLETIRLAAAAQGLDFVDWINDRKNRRTIPHRFEGCGYVPVRNQGADDHLWKIHGKRQTVYAKAGLPLKDRLAAASKLTTMKPGAELARIVLSKYDAGRSGQ